MMAEKSQTWASQDRLLRCAAIVLRSRYRSGKGYADLSPQAAEQLSKALDSAAAAGESTDGIDRREAVALAHRVVDDDHPDLSPLWPRS